MNEQFSTCIALAYYCKPYRARFRFPDRRFRGPAEARRLGGEDPLPTGFAAFFAGFRTVSTEGDAFFAGLRIAPAGALLAAGFREGFTVRPGGRVLRSGDPGRSPAPLVRFWAIRLSALPALNHSIWF